MNKLKPINKTMFTKNKYKTWYYNIINSAKLRKAPSVSEKHHIIPKSLGGNNDASNLVHLTPREHYICHACLIKITQGEELNKMIYAFWCMSNQFNKKQGARSKLYEQARKRFVQLKSQSMQGENNHFYGRSHSVETRQKISENNAMKRPEIREKCKGPRSDFLPHNHFTGWSDDVKAKISKSLTGRKISESTKDKMRGSKANLVWVYKEHTKPKQVNVSELATLLDSGWIRGRGPRAYW